MRRIIIEAEKTAKKALLNGDTVIAISNISLLLGMVAALRPAHQVVIHERLVALPKLDVQKMSNLLTTTMAELISVAPRH